MTQTFFQKCLIRTFYQLWQNKENPKGVADEPPEKDIEACLKLFASEQKPCLDELTQN